MKYLKFLAAAMLAVTVVACGDKGNEEGTKQPKSSKYIGTMVVDQNDETTFTMQDVIVELVVDGNKAEIKMNKVKFAEAMPVTLDMTIPGVTAVKTDATTALSGDNIIPLAMGGKFPNYTITGLTGTATVNNISLSMMCGEYPLTYTGTAVY